MSLLALLLALPFLFARSIEAGICVSRHSRDVSVPVDGKHQTNRIAERKNPSSDHPQSAATAAIRQGRSQDRLPLLAPQI